MSSILSHIATLTGFNIEKADADKYISDGLRDLFLRLPERTLAWARSTETVTTSGLALAGRRLLRAWKDGYAAREIHAHMASRYEAEGATLSEYDPLFYVDSQTVYVIPDGGQADLVDTPEVDVTKSETFTALPAGIVQALVFFAAMRALRHKAMLLLQQLVTELTLDAPTAPGAPTFEYTDAVAATIGTSTVGSFGTAPSYDGQSYSLVAMDTLPTLAFAGITPPTVDDSATTIGDLPDAPTLTMPTLDLSWTNYDAFYAVEDSEIMLSEVQRKRTEIEKHLADIKSTFETFQSEYQVWLPETERVLAQAGITQQSKIDALRARTEHYLAQVQRVLGEYSAKLEAVLRTYELKNTLGISLLQAKIADARASMEAEAIAFQASVQKEMQNAQMAQQRLLEQARLTTEVSLANEAQDLASKVQQYQAKLALYTTDVQSYSQQLSGLFRRAEQVLNQLIYQERLYRSEANQMQERYDRALFDLIRSETRSPEEPLVFPVM